MNKDKLIQRINELKTLTGSEKEFHDKLYFTLNDVIDFINSAIVWQDGEPPRDFVLPNGPYMLLDDGVSIYLADSWGDNDWKYAFIARHAILTPPQEKIMSKKVKVYAVYLVRFKSNGDVHAVCARKKDAKAYKRFIETNSQEKACVECWKIRP